MCKKNPTYIHLNFKLGDFNILFTVLFLLENFNDLYKYNGIIFIYNDGQFLLLLMFSL